jgi:HAD superfamily hydrolase (TIGR01490 family)
MRLAIFDLDNTLLLGDSDHAWGQYLVQQGKVDTHYYQQENDRFHREYHAGTLNIAEYHRFSLRPLTQHSLIDLQGLRASFVKDIIVPMIAPQAPALIEKHRAQGDVLVLSTATNDFITAPIAERLGIPHLLATRAEIVEGRYTGEVLGVANFQAGKIENLKLWLAGRSVEKSTVYSDSRNDLPLLEWADEAVAVHPDAHLLAVAKRQGWGVLDLG